MVAGGERGDPAAHAVAADHHAFWIDTERACGGGIVQKGEHGVRVLEIVGEAKVAWAAPRAAVIHGDGVPSGAPRRLGEVEILLVAGKAVEEHEGGMRARTRGEIRN